MANEQLVKLSDDFFQHSLDSSPTSAIMEIGSGLGFEVQITLTTYNFLKEKSDALVYTYLHIKKDGQTFSGYDIFGFSEYEDKILFVQLLDVSGIGFTGNGKARIVKLALV